MKKILWTSYKKVLIIIFLIIMFFSIKSYAIDLNEVLDEQKKSFGINDFIKEIGKYKSEFFDNYDINEIFTDAIKGKIDNSKIYNKILRIFGKEVKESIKGIIGILVIVIIHSILKAITDDLENKNISKIIYFVEYILIVGIIMNNFFEIIDLVKTTSRNLVDFINILMPILLTLMIYTGNLVTSSLIEPIILFIINFIGNMIENILIPVILVITVLNIISKISDKIQINRLSKFLNTSVVWFLGIVLTIFVGIISLEGTLSGSIDGITAKTAKAAMSNLIPVVGKVLGDSVDTVLGCGLVLKNALGIVGVIVIIGICIIPVIKIGVVSLIYNLTTVVIEPISDEKIVKLLVDMSEILKLLFGILCVISVMLIIGVTLIIKISNTGMMYR